MIKDISVYTSDKVWKKICQDIGLQIAADINLADVNIDDINMKTGVSIPDFMVAVSNAKADAENKLVKKILNQNVKLPKLQVKIITLLSKMDGLSIDELKSLLGYNPDTTTRSVENAIYQLRKQTDKNLIQNKDGKYYIGKL